MDFRIKGLEPTLFAHLFALDDAGLARHQALRCVSDGKPGFPCRVSLEDAEPGQAVLLVNYEHLPVDSPYRSRHAIYVSEQAKVPFEDVNVVPGALRDRLLSVRAIDGKGLIVDAEIVEGAALPRLVGQFFADGRVAYLHAHFARRGCFAARIDRF